MDPFLLATLDVFQEAGPQQNIFSVIAKIEALAF